LRNEIDEATAKAEKAQDEAAQANAKLNQGQKGSLL